MNAWLRAICARLAHHRHEHRWAEPDLTINSRFMCFGDQGSKRNSSPSSGPTGRRPNASALRTRLRRQQDQHRVLAGQSVPTTSCRMRISLSAIAAMRARPMAWTVITTRFRLTPYQMGSRYLKSARRVADGARHHAPDHVRRRHSPAARAKNQHSPTPPRMPRRAIRNYPAAQVRSAHDLSAEPTSLPDGTQRVQATFIQHTVTTYCRIFKTPAMRSQSCGGSSPIDFRQI